MRLRDADRDNRNRVAPRSLHTFFAPVPNVSVSAGRDGAGLTIACKEPILAVVTGTLKERRRGRKHNPTTPLARCTCCQSVCVWRTIPQSLDSLRV